MPIRHKPKNRNPIEWMDKKLEEARLREIPTKAETGFIRLVKTKIPTRIEKREEEFDDQR